MNKNKKYEQGYIPGFEIENLPKEENFRQYIKTMINKVKSPRFIQPTEIQEEKYLKNIEDTNENYDEDYMDGIISDTDEAPILKINSISDWKIPHKNSFEEQLKSTDKFPSTIQMKNEDCERNFGPHIEKNEMKQKDSDSWVYFTPINNTPESEKNRSIGKTRNIESIKHLDMKKSFKLIKQRTANENSVDSISLNNTDTQGSFKSLKKLEAPIMLKKLQTDQDLDTWQTLSIRKIWGNKKKTIKRNKFHWKSLVGSFQNTLKAPSELSRTSRYLNNLKEARSKNNSPLKLRICGKKSNSSVSSVSNSFSTFEKISLDPKIRRIKNLISSQASKESSLKHKKRKGKKLKKNVSNILRRGFGNNELMVISSKIFNKKI